MRRDELTLNNPPATDRPGSRWMCGRDHDAPPCAHGPDASGNCPLSGACRPRRTWHGRRKQITLGVLAVALIVTLIMCRPGVAPGVFKPGDLSTPHAQILSGTSTSDRCAACHGPAAVSPQTWFDNDIQGHRRVTQSDRCLDCHHQSIPRDRANLAHNVPLTVLRSIQAEIRTVSARRPEESLRSMTWHDGMPGPAVDMQNIQCAACHREHRGGEANLLDISDSQCQTCHSDRFGSFAESHPRWTGWPYGQGISVAFNHRTHAQKHFPASQKSSASVVFDCLACHQIQPNGELARSPSYEIACQSCHDAPLRIEAAEGIDLLALPTIPSGLIPSDSADDLQSWPEMATGFYDGQLAPMAELLMRVTPHAAAAIRNIPDGNLGNLNDEDPADAVAATVVASEHQRLLNEIANEGHPAILNRANQIGIPQELLGAVVRGLPPQLLQQTHQQWFTNQGESLNRDDVGRNASSRYAIQLVDFRDLTAQPPSLLVAAGPDDLLLIDDGSESGMLRDGGDALVRQDDPLGENEGVSGGLLTPDLEGDRDPLSVDPLSDDPLSSSSSAVAETSDPNQRFDPSRMLPAGGWYRDDVRLTISYRGAGHSDPVLRSVVEMMAHLQPSDPVRRRWLATRAVAACTSCHPDAAETSGWTAVANIGRRDRFTKFSHGPHLNIARLTDCTHCHAIATGSETPMQDVTLTSASGETEYLPHDEFKPLELEACATCHTAKAAGDNCTTCHRYHIDF